MEEGGSNDVRRFCGERTRSDRHVRGSVYRLNIELLADESDRTMGDETRRV